jgi:hypothetical protein
MWLCGHREPATMFAIFGLLLLQISAFSEVGFTPPAAFWILAVLFTASVIALKMTAFADLVPRGCIADTPLTAAVAERRLLSLHGRVIDQEMHVRVPLRAFYCKQLDALVRGYDSWCNTFDCPLGRTSRRWFIYALLLFAVLQLVVLGFSWHAFTDVVCAGADPKRSWLMTLLHLAVHALPCRDVPVDDSWYHFIVPSTANHCGVWLILYPILGIFGTVVVLARQLRRIGLGITKCEEDFPIAPTVTGEMTSIYAKNGRCIFSEGNFAANVLLMLLGHWGARWDGVYAVPTV